MGGRYGGADDGSDAYQDRRPDDDDLADEQQTVAEAVRAVAERQQSTDGESNSGHNDDSGHSDGRGRGDGGSDSGNGSGSGHHPFTLLRPGTNSTSGSATLQDVDQQIAEYVADQLTESVEWAVEETDPENTGEKER
jgi:hypothetical protein